MSAVTKELDEGPEKMTNEELARFMYNNDVIHDAWVKEQDSFKYSYRNLAQRFMTRLKNAGYDIIKRQPQKKDSK
jgi:hypothetical protein